MAASALISARRRLGVCTLGAAEQGQDLPFRSGAARPTDAAHGEKVKAKDRGTGRIRAHLRAPQAGRVRSGRQSRAKASLSARAPLARQMPRTAKRLKRKTEGLAASALISAHRRLGVYARGGEWMDREPAWCCPRYARTYTLGRQVDERWFTVRIARRHLKSKPES